MSARTKGERATRREDKAESTRARKNAERSGKQHAGGMTPARANGMRDQRPALKNSVVPHER